MDVGRSQGTDWNGQASVTDRPGTGFSFSVPATNGRTRRVAATPPSTERLSRALRQDRRAPAEVEAEASALSAAVLRVAARRASSRPTGPGVTAADLTLVQRLLTQTRELPAVREGLIERAKDRIEGNLYEQSRVMDKVLEGLVADLGV